MMICRTIVTVAVKKTMILGCSIVLRMMLPLVVTKAKKTSSACAFLVNCVICTFLIVVSYVMLHFYLYAGVDQIVVRLVNCLVCTLCDTSELH